MAFPENDVELMRNYIGTPWGVTPTKKIGEEVQTALGSVINVSPPIQERSPFPPHNRIPANIAAIGRRTARIRVTNSLGNLIPTLDQLNEVYTNVAKQE